MDQLEAQAQILSQRYDQLRAEMRQRYETRIKLLQFNVAILAGIFTAAVGLNNMAIALAGCGFVLVAGYMLFSETMFLKVIVGYLLKIEKTLDSEYNVQIPGWESHLKGLRRAQPNVQKLQTLAFVLVLYSTYLLFTIVGCVAIVGVWRYVIAGVLQLPAVIAITFALFAKHTFYGGWKVPADNEAEAPNSG